MGNLTDKVYEAFGIEKPAETGAQEQEVADPTQNVNTPETEGAQKQEVAEPADVSESEQVAAPSETDVVDEMDEAEQEPTGEKQPLTAQERRANAARRREQEKQQAIEEAVAVAKREAQEQYEAQMQSFFEVAKIKDTFTGEPIKTMEQFQAWQKKFQEEQLQRDLAAGKLTPEGLASAISNHPVVQQAQQMVEQANSQKEAAQDQAFAMQVEKELAQIREMDPSVHDLQDLLKLPKADAWRERVVKDGMSYLDAYKLVYGEEHAQRIAEAARQQALNNTRSKEHLKATGARGTGSVPVPAAEMRYYRILNPKMSDAEITAHYNKIMKQGGK